MIEQHLHLEFEGLRRELHAAALSRPRLDRPEHRRGGDFAPSCADSRIHPHAPHTIRRTVSRASRFGRLVRQTSFS